MDNVNPVDWRANESIPERPFPTLNDAKQTLKDYAISQGFSLVIKTSDKICTILSCSQGGVKRSHKAGAGFHSMEFADFELRRSGAHMK